MFYALCIIEDVQHQQYVTLNKNGNMYTLWFEDRELDDFISKDFTDRDAAHAILHKYLDAFAKGLYSSADRKSWLK